MTVTLCSLIVSVAILYISSLDLWICVLLLLAVVVFSSALAAYFLRDLNSGIDALELGLLNLKDGEYSTSLAYKKDDEFGELCSLYNATSEKLRAEKHWLYQRELLLDKITQSSPEVLILLNNKRQIVFSNYAAKQFFKTKTGLEGVLIDDLVQGTPVGVKEIFNGMQDGLFTMSWEQQDSQTWYLTTGEFNLNNQPHRLYILKQMTREMSRQEVAVWKKVIRVISHELNNSLGPISSMLNSGKLLAGNVEDEKLSRVFSTIDDRIQHLCDFVQGYGKFAKLPEPKLQTIDWQSFTQSLGQQWQFSLEGDTNLVLYADPIQLEQLMINLIKNAHESGSQIKDIVVSAWNVEQQVVISVKDKGKGMGESVLNNALLPFYSTKPSGTGLGLALCREIVDAHHGQIALRNRPETGLEVRISLPLQKQG
ncbi:sensor histidine kinase [Glaciecola sp. 1036]|uniref:sensor histidine kinase n=1 Tax=Alteromonadaceae TaxID=72275 RepID=UPI003CFD2B51